ncbi:MAG: 2-oxoacid:ferredoxin oxidoreductase subunit beta, partial [Deltaproteobacteria bacterium]|nr:2-oxoacid:ferredoxin oxidoreductase subunit beta [Deltaproteobacteria bacterium]
MNAETTRTFAKKDYMSDQIIRWCPGCGDYAILSQAQTVFAELQ